MKKLLTTVAALSMMTAGSAFAANTDAMTGTISIDVDFVCFLGDAVGASSDSSGTGASVDFSADGSGTTDDEAVAVDFGKFADPTEIGVITANIEFDDSWCNGAHEVTFASLNDGMTFQGTPGAVAGSDDFLLQIDYAATLTGWLNDLDIDSADATIAASVSDTVTGAFRNDADGTAGANTTDHLEVDITTVAITGNDPLLAGTYEDEITVSLIMTL